ncbi:hypothetical protein ElP_34210 [Tautonia plasticadhaerens]|uniref:DUF1593 domain-containing protein n=2 Tax=Tautonia plasticadhaerens TaxID=2527974 RepID=A0A518H3W9_9BACT|nr:nucleoside hydrolase-like domain-containing protein [Tautonia plasticadhaerens]QDV35518.1 hypothetical protein ElP_34210 [Tautonia plasticadhaerens]
MIESRRCGRWAVPVLASLLLPTMALPSHADDGPEPEQRRVLVLTDIGNEPDDSQSMVRFLLYTNEFDVEGLVATTSTWLKDRINPEMIIERVAAYGQVRENLIKHADGYPTEASLRERIKEGRAEFGMAGVGAGKDSEGSDWIIEVADRDDPRPLWVPIWGGANTLAQALWKVKQTRSPEEVERFIARLRVYTISDQDDAGPWMRETFPDLFYIVSPGCDYASATWSGISGEKHYKFEGPDFSLVSNDWIDANVQHGHGPLGKLYPDTAYIMEGDTPSFLFLIPNGLNAPEHPEWGGWGGRYEEQNGFYTNTADTVVGSDGKAYTTGQATIWRWREAYQDDFAARMDWCVQPHEEANHPPVASLGHAEELHAKAGEVVRLDAAGSSDPDGDQISYEWMFYPEAGTYRGPLEIKDADKEQARLTAPGVEEPHVAHVILKVTDDGTPALTHYRRVRITFEPSGSKDRR